MPEHFPVMLAESLEALKIRPDGVYLDCTAGLGGHTGAIARRLTSGLVIANDRDSEALELAQANTQDAADRIVFHQGPFSQLAAAVAQGDYFQYLDADGEPADPGIVTVGVTRADGTVVVAAGAATSGTGSSPRTFALTAAQATALDMLAVTWTRAADATTYPTIAEIVGGYYFTVAQARASDSSIGDEAKYPADVLRAARAEIEAEFEEICEVAFVPRYRRQRLDGAGTSCLLLPLAHPRRVVAVSDLAADGTATAWTAGEVAAIRPEVTGELHSPLRTFPAGTQNLIVAWEHGYDRPPVDVRQAALLRLRHRAIRPHTAIPDRATSFQVEGGSVFRLDQAGRKRTGIADVDAVLDRWSMAIPGIA